MRMRKLLPLFLLLMMAAVIITGCTQSSQTAAPQADIEPPADDEPPADEPKGEQILRYGASGFNGIFNPIMFENIYDGYISNIIFEKLITHTPEAEFVPAIAEWSLSEDNLTYTFTLKDGIKFSDGTDLTAKDVAFTYMTIAHPSYDGPNAHAVSNLEGYEEYHGKETETFEGIQVIDEKNISFTFKDGMAAPANIECFDYGIMPSDYYAFETWEDFLALIDKPMGSGIMTLDSYEPKQFILLKNNTNYWDPENGAQIDGVLINEVPDESILSALQAGQIDFAQISSSAENLEAAKAMDNINISNYIGNGYTFMCFNTTKPSLGDVRVRQALMHALDRESFIKVQYGEGLGAVGMVPISPASWAFPDISELNPYSFDMEKAAQLMDEAGWLMGPDGYRYKDNQKLTLSWLIYTEAAWPGTLSGMAADTWKQLGVDLSIELMDGNSVIARTMGPEPGKKDFDIYALGFSLEIDPDPTGFLFDDDACVAGGFNASGYKNSEAMDLVRAGKIEFDMEKRAEIYKEWAKIMNEEIPHVIIAYRSEIWGINKRVNDMLIDTYATWDLSLKNVTLD
jgi:peptide/nickel transport system substrate-binding protein